ncbi:MAG: hypothetical protein IJU23_11345 [Proteobacteria bacterium]|nr:hypothetical protein [Pseudomonadota bacterium]
MLAVIQDFENHVKLEGRKEGRIEGRKEEIKVITNVFKILYRNGRDDDVRRSVEDPEYLKKIMAEFGIHDDEEETD